MVDFDLSCWEISDRWESRRACCISFAVTVLKSIFSIQKFDFAMEFDFYVFLFHDFFVSNTSGNALLNLSGIW